MSAAINLFAFAVGVLLMSICLCRMRQLTPAHRWLPRLSYVALFTASFAHAFAPLLFGPMHERLGALLLAVATTMHLVVTGIDWRDGPPAEIESKTGALS